MYFIFSLLHVLMGIERPARGGPGWKLQGEKCNGLGLTSTTSNTVLVGYHILAHSVE